MGQKGHIMVQKGLKMHKKRQKIEFLDLKRRFFSLAEYGGGAEEIWRGHGEAEAAPVRRKWMISFLAMDHN